MKTYAYSLVTFGSRQISIGRQGENLATRIDVDVVPWKTEYPTGTISLFVVPPAGNGYLAAIEENGNTIRWTIRDTDTAYDGHGKAELILKDASGTVMKSVTAYTICAKSPSAAEPSDPPEAIRPWVEQILEAIKSGDVSAEAIAAAVEAYIQEHGVQVEETDPTVPDWAKQPRKPTYTASEVGARPDTWMPSASEVGADASGTAAMQVGAHNVSGEAHEDLRALIEGLTRRMNALADSDDTTLDQLSEIVAYIKSNKALIDAVTTGKVSTSDIVDNLTTNASGKVLSAAQGVALKRMIDAIVIPDKLPNPQPLTINGQSYDGSAKVEVTVTGEGGGANINDTTPSSTTTYSSQKIESELNALNEANAQQDEVIAGKANDADLAAVAKSGSYDDLSNKPTIPTVPESLKNPNKLILSGAVTAEYDGSAEVSVEIPSRGGSSETWVSPNYQLLAELTGDGEGILFAADADISTKGMYLMLFSVSGEDKVNKGNSLYAKFGGKTLIDGGYRSPSITTSSSAYSFQYAFTLFYSTGEGKALILSESKSVNGSSLTLSKPTGECIFRANCVSLYSQNSKAVFSGAFVKVWRLF